MKVPQRAEAEPVLKFLLIGESGVGKSSLLLRFVDDTFSASFATTVGIDFKVRSIPLNNGPRVKLQIWDTAGQERFRTITKAFYRGAMAVFLVFDVTQKESFDSLPHWIEDVQQQNVAPHVLRILVANKSDLVEKRVVGAAEAQVFASKHGYLYAETSACSGKGVSSVFTEMAERVWAQLNPGAVAPPLLEEVQVDVVELKDPSGDEGAAQGAPKGKSKECC